MTIYRTEYESDLIGPITLASDGESIVGCWFGNDRYFGYGVNGEMEPKDDLPVFDQARRWLDRYFAGEAPDPRELRRQPTATSRGVSCPRRASALLRAPWAGPWGTIHSASSPRATASSEPTAALPVSAGAST